MDNCEIKIDFDMDYQSELIEKLIERLNFISKLKIIDLKYIEKIILIKKSKFSARVILSKNIKNTKNLILIQSILGDDWRRTAITFRDYELGIRNFNRMFDCKRYADGTYKTAINTDITEIVKSKLKIKID